MQAVQSKLTGIVLTVYSVVWLLTAMLGVLKLLNVLPIDWAAVLAPMTLYAFCCIPVLFVVGFVALALVAAK